MDREITAPESPKRGPCEVPWWGEQDTEMEPAEQPIPIEVPERVPERVEETR
jgi:hypothetical protein